MTYYVILLIDKNHIKSRKLESNNKKKLLANRVDKKKLIKKLWKEKNQLKNTNKKAIYKINIIKKRTI